MKDCVSIKYDIKFFKSQLKVIQKALSNSELEKMIMTLTPKLDEHYSLDKQQRKLYANKMKVKNKIYRLELNKHRDFSDIYEKFSWFIHDKKEEQKAKVKYHLNSLIYKFKKY